MCQGPDPGVGGGSARQHRCLDFTDVAAVIIILLTIVVGLTL